MKISYNWLKTFIDIDETPEKLSEILTNIGLEVESWEEICNIKGELQGLIIGEVIACEKHGNADKLSITKVNIGKSENYQIVCGAHNVATGQKVVVAPVGTWVYPIEGEKFQIKSAKIRGEKSEGMICAEDEIGIGKSHDGIMVLPADTPVGVLASEYFKIKKDVLFEIGLTPNRSDAQSHKGVAEDIAAYINFHFNNNLIVKKNISSVLPSIQNPFEIEVQTEKCLSYCAVYIENVEVKPSPEWLREIMFSIGLKSINNIVDITNFILHGYGQPLHAFDADTIKDKKVLIKHLPNNTIFKALDDKEYLLNADDIVICDSNNSPLCIAGIYGGIDSGVKNETKNILLESAIFESVATRKTASRLHLRTDASQRFEKGIDFLQTKDMAFLAAQMMVETSSNAKMSDVNEIIKVPFIQEKISLRYKKVREVTGLNISNEETKKILQALHIQIIEENENGLIVLQPSNKLDVTREIDVIEEILRIYGLDKVAIPIKLQSAINPNDIYKKESRINKVSETLCGLGFSEIISNSMSQKKYYDMFEPDKEKSLVLPMNSVNANIDCMRANMLYSGLEVMSYNQNRKNIDLKLYEWGKVFEKRDSKYLETEYLSLIASGKKNIEHWKNIQKEPFDFYDLKSNLIQALSTIGVQFSFDNFAEDELLQYGQHIIFQKNIIGKIGLIHQTISKYFDITAAVFYAEIKLNDIIVAASKNKIQYLAVSKFQDVKRDLAIVIDKDIEYASIEKLAKEVCGNELHRISLFDVFEDEKKIGEGKKSYAINFVFSNSTKTYTDNQIDAMMHNMKAKLEENFNAQIRS